MQRTDQGEKSYRRGESDAHVKAALRASPRTLTGVEPEK